MIKVSHSVGQLLSLGDITHTTDQIASRLQRQDRIVTLSTHAYITNLMIERCYLPGALHSKVLEQRGQSCI